MVSCVVPDCHNYSEKTGEAVSYHKFPQDHRTKAWLDRVRRVDMPPLKNVFAANTSCPAVLRSISVHN